MSIKTRIIIGTLVGLTIIVLGTLYSEVCPIEEISTSTPIVTVVASPDVQTKVDNYNAKKIRQRLANLYAKDEEQNDESRFPTLTDEQLAHYDAIAKKVDPVYFERAPGLLEEMLQDEIKDRYWSSTVSQDIEKLLNNEALETSDLVAVDCRKTLCKVNIDLAGKNKVDPFRQLWSRQGPPTGSRFGMPIETDEGTVKLTMYFARPEEGAEPFLKMRERMAANIEAE